MVQNRVRRNPDKYKSELFEDFKNSAKQWIKDITKDEKTPEDFIRWLKEYREDLQKK